MGEENEKMHEKINSSFTIYEVEDMTKLTYRQQLLVTRYRENITRINPLFRLQNNIEEKEESNHWMELHKVKMDVKPIRLKARCYCIHNAHEMFDFILFLEKMGKYRFEISRLKKRLYLNTQQCQCHKLRTTFRYLSVLIEKIDKRIK
ncbi:hypothetical protein ECANGB1_1169 [Enterospora canceri]|uniref:Uncharacterized protein n=1 Tax=Enterospora canceri TaxID=1081671 RepID=A0A1Y1S6M2_9MICR|nr:hypothetical protein ECANGB1_1169 [Enterospora canceri]